MAPPLLNTKFVQYPYIHHYQVNELWYKNTIFAAYETSVLLHIPVWQVDTSHLLIIERNYLRDDFSNLIFFLPSAYRLLRGLTSKVQTHTHTHAHIHSYSFHVVMLVMIALESKNADIPRWLFIKQFAIIKHCPKRLSRNDRYWFPDFSKYTYKVEKNVNMKV